MDDIDQFYRSDRWILQMLICCCNIGKFMGVFLTNLANIEMVISQEALEARVSYFMDL